MGQLLGAAFRCSALTKRSVRRRSGSSAPRAVPLPALPAAGPEDRPAPSQRLAAPVPGPQMSLPRLQGEAEA